jgi:hypothetical protein
MADSLVLNNRRVWDEEAGGSLAHLPHCGNRYFSRGSLHRPYFNGSLSGLSEPAKLQAANDRLSRLSRSTVI